MASPTITTTDVTAVGPTVSDVVHIGDGGQKRVFRAELNGVQYAIKFMRPTVQQWSAPDAAVDVSVVDDVTARAAREVETMRRCTSPHLVKQGPIGLTQVDLRGERILYFTEEYIDGVTLAEHLRNHGTLDVPALKRLGIQVALAIQRLSSNVFSACQAA